MLFSLYLPLVGILQGKHIFYSKGVVCYSLETMVNLVSASFLNLFLPWCPFGTLFAQTCTIRPTGICFSQSKDYVTLDYILWTHIPNPESKPMNTHRGNSYHDSTAGLSLARCLAIFWLLGFISQMVPRSFIC